MPATDLEVARLPARDAAVDAELDRFFEACPRSFAQQTRSWRDAIIGVAGDEPAFLGCRRGGALVGVLPAYRFEGPLGAVLNSVPQAGPLGGIACLPGAPEDAIYPALLSAYVELGRATGCACASLITNPFWPDLDRYRRARPCDFLLRNTCQVLDLADALDADGQPARASRNLRRNLRRACDGSLVVDDEQSGDNVAAWYAIHEARHREIGAVPLPRALFEGALAHMVPADKARFFFVRLADSGEMVAGAFYVHHGGVVDALMPAMCSRYAHLEPNTLLALHSIRWARERGFRYYNWQPSPPTGGVRRFKLQWGSGERDYAYLTWVTGDMQAILAATPEAIRAGYPWHYVVPFDRLGADGERAPGESTRAGAWQALETPR